jgi:hypothetical protein
MSEQDNSLDHDAVDSIKSRQIVSEILDFGVNQYQLKKILKFLALELEDRDLMLNLCSILEDKPLVEKPKIEL